MKSKNENKSITLYYQPVIIEDVKTHLQTDPQYRRLLKDCHLNKIIHLISYLYLKPITDKRYSDRYQFIYISAEFFLRMYSARLYPDILKALLKYDIIEVNEKGYKVGKRTKSYRIHTKYNGYKFIAIQCGGVLAGKQIIYRNQSRDKNPAKKEKLKKQLEQVLHAVSIDYTAAEQYLLRQLEYSLRHPETIDVKEHIYFQAGKFIPKKDHGETEAKEQFLRLLEEVKTIVPTDTFISPELTLDGLLRVMNKYMSNLISIKRIHQKDFNCDYDQTSGRLHTNLTNLSRDLKPFLRLREQKIVGRDLVSSQPVFLSCLLLSDYDNNEMPDDVLKYIQLCLDGGKNGPDIYQYLMQKTGISDRRAFKTCFYEKVLFGRVSKKKNKVAKIFEKEFPSVWEFICKQKSNTSGRWRDKAHARLAIKLQTLEAHMFLGAAGELINMGVEVLTLHDAIYVIDTPENVALVDMVILSKFMKEYKVKPTVSD